MLRGKRKTFGNLAGHVRGMEDVQLAGAVDRRTVRSVAELEGRRMDQGPVAGQADLKGVLDVEDATRAAKTGATALVVSNHGGRQLDGACRRSRRCRGSSTPSARAIEIMFDGGIRSGQDVMRALALGARSCLIGRAYLYGLGAGGQAGVARAIEILRNELDVTMALTGTASVKDIGRGVLSET